MDWGPRPTYGASGLPQVLLLLKTGMSLKANVICIQKLWFLVVFDDYAHFRKHQIDAECNSLHKILIEFVLSSHLDPIGDQNGVQ